MNKNVQILSIEGKDLLIKKYSVDKNTIRKGSLDDSMENDELKTLGKYVIKINKKKKRLYCDDIINVTFKYACNSDKDLTDEEYERVESLKKVIDMVDNENDIKNTKELLNLAKGDISIKEIRKQLYEYGFNININGKYKHFKRYKRTSGSARVGKCLFINEKFYQQMIDWSFAGIPHEYGIDMDCAGMEAYISLPTSSAIDRFELKPENILLIDDVYSEFDDTVMATELINKKYDDNKNVIGGDLSTDIKTAKIKNNLFDGECLLDKSIFEDNGYDDKATLQLRNLFYKGIGVNTDIQKFFKDNNITRIDQLNGKTKATNIQDIKLITTPSSVKYLKFGTFEQWLKYLKTNWAICKYEKPQHHLNGMVQTHYQLLNTLGMSKKEMESFLEDTIEYINLLKNNISVFKHHIGINLDTKDKNSIDKKEDLSCNIDSTNDFILNMLEINDDFQYTKMCKKYRKNNIDSYIRNIRKGHVLVEGNYSVIVSCPYEFLLSSIGKFNGNSELKPFECVSSKFEKGERLLAVRSPEPTMSNITMLNNTRNSNIERYFNTKSKEVCYISPINNNIMELLSSCDFDGDTFLITNNKHLVKAGNRLQEDVEVNKKTIKRFLVSTDFTPKSNIKRKYTYEDLCDTDIKCSSNKIGEIINLAQMLNSVYWDKKHNKCPEEELLDLYKDISNLNVLSCIEIDRAKKISPVDARKELNKIRTKHSLGKGYIIRNKEKKEVGIRPMFFKYLDGGRDYKFKRFNTGMDYLNDVLNERLKCTPKKYSKNINLSHILCKLKASKADRKLIENIKNIVEKNKKFNSKIWASNIDNKYELIMEEKQVMINKLKKYKITPEVIYTIISRINKGYDNEKYEEYKKIGLSIMKSLYENDKYTFLKCIKIKSKENRTIVKDVNGDVSLYGVKYSIK